MKPRLLLLTFAALAVARAQTNATPDAVAETERALEHAYLAADVPGLAAVTKQVDAALAAEPKNPAWQYEQAFAAYAAATPLRTANRKDALVAQFEKTAALLDRVKGQPW